MLTRRVVVSVLGILFELIGAKVTFAQLPYYFTPTDMVMFAGDDTVVTIPFGVGSFNSHSQFVADSGQHTFTARLISSTGGVTFLGPLSGQFRGYDTLRFRYQPPDDTAMTFPDWRCLVQVDTFKDTVESYVEAWGYHPAELDWAFGGKHDTLVSEIKIGANRLPVPDHYLGSRNALPVYLIDLKVIGDPRISIDSSQPLPDTLINGYLGSPIKLRVHSPSTPSSLHATLIATLRAGKLTKTNSYPVTINAVQYPEDCIYGWFDQREIAYPWKLNGTLSLQYHNPQPLPVRIDSAAIGSATAPYFTVRTALPLLINGNDSGVFHLSYSLPSDTITSVPNGMVTLYLSGLDSDGISCPNNSFYFELPLQTRFQDSAAITLYPLDTSVITMTTEEARIYKGITLINNGNADMKISDVRIAEMTSNGFSVLHIELPADSIIQVGASFRVYLEWSNNAHYWGIYDSAHLVISVNGNKDFLPPKPILLLGSQLPIWIGVAKAAERSRTRVFPNPAHSRVTVVNSSAFIQEVYLGDALGRKLLGRRTEDKTVELDVGNIPSGVYYLNVLTYGTGHATSEQHQVIIAH